MTPSAFTATCLDWWLVLNGFIRANESTFTFLEGANGRIEVLEPAGSESAISRFLAKRGEGMHHVCFRVQDAMKMASRMAEAGYQVIDQRPRIGLEGERLVFIHPKSSHGVLIELLEPAGDG